MKLVFSSSEGAPGARVCTWHGDWRAKDGQTFGNEGHRSERGNSPVSTWSSQWERVSRWGGVPIIGIELIESAPSPSRPVQTDRHPSLRKVNFSPKDLFVFEVTSISDRVLTAFRKKHAVFPQGQEKVTQIHCVFVQTKNLFWFTNYNFCGRYYQIFLFINIFYICVFI